MPAVHFDVFERKSASSFPDRIHFKCIFSLAELILGSFRFFPILFSVYYEVQNNSVELVDPSIAFKTTWSDFFVCWWYNSVPFLTHIYIYWLFGSRVFEWLKIKNGCKKYLSKGIQQCKMWRKYVQCTHINCGITPISLSSTHIHTQ